MGCMAVAKRVIYYSVNSRSASTFKKHVRPSAEGQLVTRDRVCLDQSDG